MIPALPRRSPDELARIGEEIYERRIRPILKPEDNGRYVAIDVVSGEYEIDSDDYVAVMRLRGRLPTAEMWLVRAGHPTAYVLRRGQ